MKWSWKLGKLFGIDLYLHATFLILLAWVGASHYLRERTIVAALASVGFTLAVFGIVVLHELGHALTARRFGIRTRDITLLPIGGVSRLERMPEAPAQELLVALAGPAVNVVIAALLVAALSVLGMTSFLAKPGLQLPGPFVAQLVWVNVSLAVFNLIPAFPMDGGRVLRAVLAMRSDFVTATQRAARIGKGIALLLGIVGLFFNTFLTFIALFVWMGAAAEAASVESRAEIEGIPVEAAMITDFRMLRPNDPLRTAVALLLAGSQVDFPVAEDGQLVGVLTRADLLRELARRGPEGSVADAMQRRFAVARANEMLSDAVARLAACPQCSAMPVVENGEVIGIVTMENVGELMMVRRALTPGRANTRRTPFGGWDELAHRGA